MVRELKARHLIGREFLNDMTKQLQNIVNEYKF